MMPPLGFGVLPKIEKEIDSKNPSYDFVERYIP